MNAAGRIRAGQAVPISPEVRILVPPLHGHSDMDFAKIRRITITALFSDELLLEYLVFKGGNALSLVYELSSRSSLDLDFSIEKDFADIDDIQERLFSSLLKKGF